MDTQTSRSELQALIKPAIQRFRDGDRSKPTFTHEQLIMFALVLQERTLTTSEIIRWALDTFKYYNDLLLDSISSDKNFTNVCLASADSKEAFGFTRALRKAFKSYDLPVRDILVKTEFKDHAEEIRESQRTEQEWEISLPQARVLLEAALLPRKPLQKTIFFDLPGELRNRIYEMVLSFPDAALQHERHGRFTGKKLIVKEGDSAVRGRLWSPHPKKYTPTISSMLNLLLANKQLHQEAVHVFYNINSFACMSLADLHDFLTRVPASHAQHLRHLIVRYTGSDQSIARKVVKKIAEIKHLEELTIRIDEGSVVRRSTPTGMRRQGEDYEVLQLPGVAELRSIRGLKRVEVVGEGSLLRECLEREMVLPVTTEAEKRAEKRGVRKRKASLEEEVHESPKKRVQNRKVRRRG